MSYLALLLALTGWHSLPDAAMRVRAGHCARPGIRAWSDADPRDRRGRRVSYRLRHGRICPRRTATVYIWRDGGPAATTDTRKVSYR